MDLIEEFEITRVERDNFLTKIDQVAKEFPLKIFVNNKELVSLTCSPNHLQELALGYLFSEGYFSEFNDVKSINLKEENIFVELRRINDEIGEYKHKIITSGCGRSTIYTDLTGKDLQKVKLDIQAPHDLIYHLASELNKRSELFKETGGVHNALLGNVTSDFLIFREDIGRHNAVDKLIGHLVLNNYSAKDKILITTGRISSEILLKTARQQIPILVSRSAPTDLAVRLAYRLGITLIGFARGKRMNIYTHFTRVI